MTVNNVLEMNSLKGVCNFSLIEKDVRRLLDIDKYISDIGESMQNSENIYSFVLDNDEFFFNWMYSDDDSLANDADLKRAVIEVLTKNDVCTDVCSDNAINISYGEFEGCVSDKDGYVKARRAILNLARNVSEYYDFMSSCFINCEFSEDILSEMKKIQSFSSCQKAITQNLSVLNDEAMDLYKSNKNDLSKAVKELSAKLLECSLDPNHRKKLVFRFKYEDEDKIEREKYITCEPHLKLIRKDSDLRIYFNWCDEDVGKGEKVLIGRIGSHPY